MIKIKGLNKYYNKNKQNEIHVLNGIDLQLPEKGMVAIFGKSGCGKTTLLNVIGGLDKAHSGYIEINGENIFKDTDSVRNKYIGYIFQNYNLNASETCFDNVANALRLCGIRDDDTIKQRVLAALKNVGMDKYEKRTPDTLSGGQMQRIAIARAIVKNPRIVLADEPTGNLDAENTILIMDLLKEISKDHLVLIVTHEKDLVDYYCDRVIEIVDGKIMSVRNNDSATGYFEKPKNNIYLGEFEKSVLSNERLNIEYYGETPKEKVDIKIINSDGKIFIKFGNEKSIQIIDESSETKLVSGVFEATCENKEKNFKNIQMEKIPTVEGKNFGKLFTFREGIITGFKNNFLNKKKKRKLLYFCMALFAVTMVFSLAFFGTSIRDIKNIESEVSTDIFHVLAKDKEVQELLFSNIGQNGIKDIILEYDAPENLYFYLKKIQFETEKNNYSDSKQYPAVYLNVKNAEELELICGKNKNISDKEAVITSNLADRILEDSIYGYLKTYEDILNFQNYDGFTIVGIVKSENPQVFYTENALAKINYSKGSEINVIKDTDTGYILSDGEVLICYVFFTEEKTQNGDTFTLNGVNLTIKGVISPNDYHGWCDVKGYTYYENEQDFFEYLIAKEHSDLMPDTSEYSKVLEKYYNERYFEYYDANYAHLDEFFKETQGISTSFYCWLYNEKGIEDARYLFIGDSLYYSAMLYKSANGNYPAKGDIEYDEKCQIALENLTTELQKKYYVEYTELNVYKPYYDYTVIVSEEDYFKAAHRTGKTTRIDEINEKYDDYGYDYYHISYYTILSDDPEITENFINNEIVPYYQEYYNGDKTLYGYDPVYTPESLLDKKFEESRKGIISNITTMAVFALLMCGCIFLIMRSSVILRIKEIGIFRAVGVSRRNMVFKFATEAFVLATGTVLPGYLFSSIAIGLWINESMLMKDMFYYPIYLAAILLAFIYLVCIFAGILPVLTLLRKTPSQILSKYDI